ncbi:MAG: DUF4860 domain-containing protein [Clostridia bacterium]|nr:DUF4860 domain-containing protein [Clostridia bacterium]
MSARKKQQPPMRIQNVFIFLLLAIFAISAIFLTALSAQVYRDTVDTSNRNNTARVVAAIVRGAVQGEDAGNVSIRQEGGIPVLVFTNDYDGEIYLRRLFCAGGYLRESFTSEEWEFEEEMGEPLMEVTSFEPEIQDNMLTARVTTPDGGEQEIYVYLRAGGVAE